MPPSPLAPPRTEAHTTLRQAGWVVVFRVLFLITGFLFVALIPRLMGPHTYGQFSLLQSVSYWFSAFSSMGSVSMLTRFVPEFTARGDRSGLARLVSGLLAVRLWGSLLSGLGYLLFLALWLRRDIGFAELLLMAAAVAARTISTLPYTLFLGLNQAARWELGEGIRRVLGLLFVYFGYLAADFRGACAGLLAADFVVLACGLWWARHYFARSFIRLDRNFLAPYLRFGVSFFVSNLLIMLFHQAGAGMVQLFSGQYAETGYYHLAFHLYITVTLAAWQVLCTFGPLFSSLHAQGRTTELRAWSERLLCFLGIASVLGCALAFTFGEAVVRLVVGRQYLPVAPLLPWLAVATLTFAPGGLARLLAVTYGLPQASSTSAILQLVTFVLACIYWVPRHGSLGACYGVILAGAVFAAVGTWQMRPSLPYSLRRWCLVLGLGLACSPAIWAFALHPGLRLALFLLSYATALWSLGILRRSEWEVLWRRTA